ncbi:formate dehydrogenase (NAD+) [Xylographa soralifera]|nr:formate dehydrogenase (NAD+) [Xylographa soralifera]
MARFSAGLDKQDSPVDASRQASYTKSTSKALLMGEFDANAPGKSTQRISAPPNRWIERWSIRASRPKYLHLQRVRTTCLLSSFFSTALSISNNDLIAPLPAVIQHGICSLSFAPLTPVLFPPHIQAIELLTPHFACRWSPPSLRNVIAAGSSSTPPLPAGRTAEAQLLTKAVRWQGKVLLVLYDGGEHGRDVPEMLGTTENELGIRPWLEENGHTLVTTSDKEGENSKFDQELVDAEVIITTPFHPGYLTAERLAKAKKLKLAITAGIGSDHVDLDAANKTNGGVTVAEVTGSNVVSVAEHVVMTILTLVRNFVPAHEQIQAGEWNVAAVAKNEYDLEGKVVGTVAVGRIGERVLRRLKPFDCKELLYFDYQPLKPDVEKEIGCRRVDSLEEMLGQCDVVTINCPLHEKTRGLFNKELISKMKKGAWLVNTARGAIVVKEDVADALKSGHLRGYGGDVWFPQPAPKDHPLRYAKNPFGGGNAMVPHMSGTSIDAQQRYAAGTKAILDSYFSGREDYRPQDLIVHKGDYATKAYGQRNAAAPGLH